MLATDEELAKLPRTNLWDELTKGKPPRIAPDDAKITPGAQKFLTSLDSVHYPGDSGMLAIFDKDIYGGTKPILDLTPNNIVAIHKQGDLNDPAYQKSSEHTRAVLEGAILSKFTNQPPGTPSNKATCVIETPATDTGGKPSLSKLIMAYAAEKTGLHAVGSDGNKIDTSSLPAEVKTQMDKQWEDMRVKYGVPAVAETFNPAAGASPAPAAAPAAATPAAAAPDPNKALTAQEIGAKAIANATTRWGADVKLDDKTNVYQHLLDWTAKLDTGAKTPEAQAANRLHTALTDGGGNMTPEAIVAAVTKYQTDLKAAGYSPTADKIGFVEDISMATQAFAAKNNVSGVDPKLYHQFQPSDGMTNAQVGIPAAAPPPSTAAPAAPKQP